MDYEALDNWVKERLAEGEDETVYTFFREVMDKSRGYDDYRDASEAKMREYEERDSERSKEIDALKAKNYDLLMGSNSNNDADGEVIENNEEDGEIYHIDNLFVDDDEEDER